MRRNILLFFIALLSFVFIACETSTVYYHFESTPISGWERNDTLKFSVPALKVAGGYHEDISLRLNSDYPFMGLTLIVDQTVFPGRRHVSDTVNCRVVDQDGNVKGRGIGFYEYDYPLTHLKLNAGDSLQINVRHNMKREILPGVADIGIKVTRN